MSNDDWRMTNGGILRKANRRISNIEPQNFEGWFRFAQSFYKIDRIPYFDIRYSLFDIRYSLYHKLPTAEVYLNQQPLNHEPLSPDLRPCEPATSEFRTFKALHSVS